MSEYDQVPLRVPGRYADGDPELRLARPISAGRFHCSRFEDPAYSKAVGDLKNKGLGVRAIARELKMPPSSVSKVLSMRA